jgi:hypothetical protein
MMVEIRSENKFVNETILNGVNTMNIKRKAPFFLGRKSQTTLLNPGG